MYLEIKALISGIGIVLLFFVLSQVATANIAYGMLMFIGIFLIILSDIIISYKITNNNAQYFIDPIPQGTQEICLLKTLSGLLEIIPVTKGPKGIRYGLLHKKKIAILNEGDDQFHTRNGNLGFFAHENYDKNINLKECKALEKLDGEDIKAIYKNLKNKKSKEGVVWSSKKKTLINR